MRGGSWPEDWEGPTCLLIYGVERPELWGGSCGAVTVTLRHKTNFVDLSNRGRVIWGTYASGFHVARLVVKLADGTFLVGDPGTGTSDVSHIENEVVLSSLRWLKLDVPQNCYARYLGGEARSVQGGRDWFGNKLFTDCSHLATTTLAIQAKGQGCLEQPAKERIAPEQTEHGRDTANGE